MDRRVQWVGGPYDGDTFKVPRDKKIIRVGMTWLDMDLDKGGRILARRVAEWPIERIGWRYFVYWREDD